MCGSYFNYKNADAICRKFNFTSCSTWNYLEDYSSIYSMRLEGMDCSGTDCDYTEGYDCDIYWTVVMSCTNKGFTLNMNYDDRYAMTINYNNQLHNY